MLILSKYLYQFFFGNDYQFFRQRRLFAAAATDSKRLAVIEKTPEDIPDEFFNFVLPLKIAIETKLLLGSDGTVTPELPVSRVEYRPNLLIF